MINEKEYREDTELILQSLIKVIENQNQIIKGIISLAKKEGLEVTIKDKNGEVKYNGKN